MADCGFLPLPVCIQCGTNQNPCHVKIVGPTLGFIVGVCMANARDSRRYVRSDKQCDTLLATTILSNAGLSLNTLRAI
ncbi:hypothetical protein D0868_09306 [Hortaea werneckii]|uniref:Uncharacterized protein n=1 Tax=Hortaea werneckii TaxID=91943 RepID=A0A3M6YA21_HORWE|nr:hypothetical protein D0868_09306 [Hortaea werneckii]RMY29492.1 hypothetical protein D0866_08659 [Hortaea werneckii]